MVKYIKLEDAQDIIESIPCDVHSCYRCLYSKLGKCEVVKELYKLPNVEIEEDNSWKQIIKLRLLANFEGSFFNDREEFVAHKYSNTYFIFARCENKEDVNCKVLEWLSRSAYKGQCYSQEWKNKKIRKFMLDGINKFLYTDFTENDIELIYQELGHCVNHNKTIEFVRSGYDMNLLKGDK